jgi:glycosidase
MNRFLWVARGDIRKLKLAALCQFTLTGAPVIYYGTEVGLSQHNDVMQNGRAIHEEARLPMLWGEQQDRDLFNFYKELIAFRKSHPVLRQGTRETFHADEQTLAYRRRNGEASLVTVLNISDEEASLALELAESTAAFATNAECKIQEKGEKKHIVLPPYSGMVVH